MFVVRNDTLFWRKPLLTGPQKLYVCTEYAPPFSPSTMDSINISDVSHFSTSKLLVVSLLVTWESPLYSNGALQEFELRVGACQDVNDFVREWVKINVS